MISRRTHAVLGGISAAGLAVQRDLALPQLGGHPARPLQDALHGVWLGHPLHPALATLPVGCWTLALGLDAASSLGSPGTRVP